MTKEQIKEIKVFLIYLHLLAEHVTGELSTEGFSYLVELKGKNPQFKNIENENEKIFRWLDEEEKE